MSNKLTKVLISFFVGAVIGGIGGHVVVKHIMDDRAVQISAKDYSQDPFAQGNAPQAGGTTAKEFTLNDCGIGPVVVTVEKGSSVWEAAEYVYGHRGADFLVRVITNLQHRINFDREIDPQHAKVRDADDVPPGFKFVVYYDGWAAPVYPAPTEEK